MNKLTRFIRNANYAKLFKWWLILGICAALLGGCVSAALLRPQLQEAQTAITAREQEDHADTEKRHEERDWEKLAISEPSTAAKVSVAATALAALLFAGVYWLLFAAWLTKKAWAANMNGLLWGCLVLIGNLPVGVLFFLTRSFLRRKCPACGLWQPKGTYCRACGSAMVRPCPDCGQACALGDHYCSACGARLED